MKVVYNRTSEMALLPGFGGKHQNNILCCRGALGILQRLHPACSPSKSFKVIFAVTGEGERQSGVQERVILTTAQSRCIVKYELLQGIPQRDAFIVSLPEFYSEAQRCSAGSREFCFARKVSARAYVLDLFQNTL